MVEHHDQLTDVLIIGAGLSGLMAAKTLKAAGKTVKVLEASDDVGGRVRTDEVDGFRLDRGFQVLLTAYPETQKYLDYESLDLRSFKPGALILNERGITEIGDPLREPSALFKTLASTSGTLKDKLGMLQLKLRLSSSSLEEIFAKPEIRTINYLEQQGFSDKIISQFFKPFMAGIFLEEQLHTSSRMFEFVFKMFGGGDTAVPAKGMGMIPKQLAEGLTSSELLLNQKVIQVNDRSVQTAAGDNYAAKTILIATSMADLPIPFTHLHAPRNSVCNIYFSADKAPFTRPIIALNASVKKLVNNIAVMDQVSSLYAPESKSLISVSLIGDHQQEDTSDLTDRVKDELQFWYPEAISWKFLKIYHISYALPKDEHVLNDQDLSAFKLKDNCFICGDHLLNGSINAAMRSGRMAAEAILCKSN